MGTQYLIHSIIPAPSVVIRCTINDTPSARVSAPDTGSHDDAPLVRSATVIVKAPTVEFSGSELVNGTLRACAGGIDDHAATDAQYRAHTRQVELTAKFDGKPLPNARFSLRFAGNKGHDYGDGREKKMARLHKTSEAFDAAHPWTETLDMTADGAGKVSVWVLSSDVINKPTLQAILKPVAAPKEPLKLGEIGCDFAASVSIRRFVPKKANGEPSIDPDEKDTGWIFDFPNLANPDNDQHMTPAKVYLKFKKNEGLPDGQDGNWQFANGHKVRISIHSVEVLDEESGEVRTIEGTPAELQRYAFVAPQARGPETSGEIEAESETTTKGETAPQVYICGGPDLDKVTLITVKVEDLTEHKE